MRRIGLEICVSSNRFQGFWMEVSFCAVGNQLHFVVHAVIESVWDWNRCEPSTGKVEKLQTRESIFIAGFAVVESLSQA